MTELTLRQDTIAFEPALTAAKAAIDHARQIGALINVAVVDAGGNLLVFLRDSGAFLHSVTIAQDKALTALGFKMPTGDLHELIKGAPAVRDGIIRRDRLAAFGGGFPILVGGAVVGGIGVSGASEEQDAACARAGLAAIGLLD